MVRRHGGSLFFAIRVDWVLVTRNAALLFLHWPICMQAMPNPETTRVQFRLGNLCFVALSYRQVACSIIGLTLVLTTLGSRECQHTFSFLQITGNPALRD